ncbi:MAG: archease [Candidatus Aenigmatarchaeota archaeon]|nr:MAG: archease [Candidatus Aenigmarchaeota archaeon]
MGGFHFLEHISDVLVEAWGETLEEAFKQAAKAFFETMVDTNKIEKKKTENITAEGFDLQSLLYEWLEQLLIVHEVKNMVFSEFDVKIIKKQDNYFLKAVAYGENYNPEKHSSKVAIKAITYHEMEIKKEDDRYVVKFLLDI